MNEWIDDGWMHGCVGGRMDDECMDGWVNGRWMMDTRMEDG